MANNITITRRVKIFVAEQDAQQKKDYIHTIYMWRDAVRKAANMVVAHKFCQQNIKDFIYLKDEIKEKFYVKDILKEGKGMSEQNTTYRVLSDMLKGTGVRSDMITCLNQSIANTFKETYSDILRGKASVRSYKNNIQMPFSGKHLNSIKWSEEDKRYYFTLFNIPFGISLGRDRSNNKVIIERCLSGEYKFCGSAIMIDDNAKCFYLYMTVQLPVEDNKLDSDKTCFAILSLANPIVAQIDGSSWTYEIGTAEEFIYRRRQIQEALKRAHINAKYSVGGKGRKRKCQVIERFEDKENNYVRTKMHEYSRRLIDYAVKNGCGVIHLLANKEQSEKDKGEELLLRNWSYHGLREMIAYKCKKAGIELKYDK